MAVQTRKKHKKRRNSPLLSFFKGLYIALVAVSTVIVVLWCAFQLFIKPPALATPTPPPTQAQPADVPTPSASQAPDATPTPAPTPPPERKGDWYQTFLLVGTDDGNGNADTIMVASFDTRNNKVGVVSIPRDTLVDEPRTVKKINGAYGVGGVKELLREASELVGFPIDHYIKVDIAAFVALVNELGGVSYYVPCDMYHNDGAGFIIDLKEGLQYLDGNQALQLVRYRGYANADLGRIQTQQNFLKEMAKQTLKVSNLGKIDSFAKIFAQYVDTDLSVTDIIFYATEALSLDLSGDISFATLPGNGEVHYNGVRYYYQLYPQQSLDLFNQLINPYTTDLTMDMVEIYQVQ